MEVPEPNGPSCPAAATPRAAPEVSRLRAVSIGEGLRGQGLQGRMVCVREEAAHPACLSSCLLPTSPTSVLALAAGRSLETAATEGKAGAVPAGRAGAWKLATACPRQEAWVS